MKELLLATNNPGKIAELQALLFPIHCISQYELGIDSVEETGLSFIENAILKARHASRMAKKPALADDSGLVVPILQGAPGIYSARFSGPDATDEANNLALLKQLDSVDDEHRHAYFYCALALVQHADDPTPIITTGKLDGLITRTPKGHQGFGYNPIFYLPAYQCTVAELSMEIKNTISHRAIALQQLSAILHADQHIS